jgi:hypothetical protein
MNRPPSDPAARGLPVHGLHLRVERSAPPPLPWIWVIHREGDAPPVRRALRAYRSAEEAWEAGRAVLARLGGPGDPKG